MCIHYIRPLMSVRLVAMRVFMYGTHSVLYECTNEHHTDQVLTAYFCRFFTTDEYFINYTLVHFKACNYIVQPALHQNKCDLLHSLTLQKSCASCRPSAAKVSPLCCNKPAELDRFLLGVAGWFVLQC